ncbi:hypothetical protein [Rummeliibacillus pycnus]|uniref:hypothetical protein n=1 Tax=Rummeliibacillus pycnus TaxID=101070 RepID=UPI003D27646C
MLPGILDIAEQNGIFFNPHTFGKKETTCKCPFCNEDANKDKWYLSLNTHDNVYKCWYCGVKGGVLDFEARLTGVPYQEIKEKYFPKKKKKTHDAYNLNNHQLKKIGWDEFKRQSVAEFRQKKDEVLKDWQDYEYRELRKLFAIFMCVSALECTNEVRLDKLQLVMDLAEKTKIYLAFSKLVEQFTLDFEDRCDWAREGTEIGRMAWRTSMATMDFEMEQVLLNVLFINFGFNDREINGNDAYMYSVSDNKQ